VLLQPLEQLEPGICLRIVHLRRPHQVLDLERLVIIYALAERISDADDERSISRRKKPGAEGRRTNKGVWRDTDETGQRRAVVAQFLAHQRAERRKLNGAERLVAGA